MRKRKFLTNIRSSLILDLGHGSSKENSPSNQECWLYENLGPLKGSCDNTVDQPRGINVVQFPTISHKRTRIEEIKHALFSQLQRPKRKPLQEFFIDAEEELESKWHYRKFSNKGVPAPIEAPPFDPKPTGFLDVFRHISAKNGPILNL